MRRSRTLLLKVEKGGGLHLTVSKCFTPCFTAEVVTGAGAGAGDDASGGASTSADNNPVLLTRDDVERGDVIQLRITLNPPEELTQVEQNFKGKVDHRSLHQTEATREPRRVAPSPLLPTPFFVGRCDKHLTDVLTLDCCRPSMAARLADSIVILANETIVEVPVYALGKVRGSKGFDIVDDLSKFKHWPKPQVLESLLLNFVNQYHLPALQLAGHSRTTTASLPGSRQAALRSLSHSRGTVGGGTAGGMLGMTGGGSSFGGTLASLGATGGASAMASASASGLGLGLAATWQQQQQQKSLSNGTQHLAPVDPLTKSEIAFEIEGVFYNTLGAEIGRLGDSVNIFHLNEVEDDDLPPGGEDPREELDLEESQVIADQQLIASQLVSYLDLMQREGGAVNLDDIEQLSMQMHQLMPLGAHSQLSSATTSYQGTRINTPAAAAVAAEAEAPSAMASMPNPLPPVRHKPGSAAERDRASSAAALVRPAPLPARPVSREREPEREDVPPAMATPSKISYQQMQANWDAIEGI